jgi:hypothetical protein
MREIAQAMVSTLDNESKARQDENTRGREREKGEGVEIGTCFAQGFIHFLWQWSNVRHKCMFVLGIDRDSINGSIVS